MQLLSTNVKARQINDDWFDLIKHVFRTIIVEHHQRL